MILSLGQDIAFNIVKPPVINSPRRMYITINGASKEEIEKKFDISRTTIDGKQLDGFNQVIFIRQDGNRVMVCVGG